MSTDAIVFIKDEHKKMRRLFREFEKNDDNPEKRGTVVRELIELLVIHTYLENEIMYPEVRKLMPEVEDDVLESYEEHHVGDLLCAELWDMDPADEHFKAKTTVLIENVEHHLEEEEDEWFPKVRKGLSRKVLQDMGKRMIDARPAAPRTPTDPAHRRTAEHAETA